MLRKNYQLNLVESGEDCLAELDDFMPDFILLDIDLLGMSGFETCEQIKCNPKYKKIIVIHVSSSSDIKDRRQSLETGADDFILKPFNYPEICRTLDKFVRIKELEQKLSETNIIQMKSKDLQLETINGRFKYEMEQKAALEQKYFSLVTKYRNIVNNCRDGIVVAQNEKLLYANPRLMHITGFSHDELTSNKFSKFIHESDRKMVVERHRRRMRGGNEIRRYNFRIVTKDHKAKWVELREAKTINWGQNLATIAFITDLDKPEGKKKSSGELKIE